MAVAAVYPYSYLDRIFSNAQHTAGLLKPEIDNGNLTLNDYNRSITFFGRWYKHASTALCGLGIFLGILPRKRNVLYAFLGGSLGAAAGEVLVYRDHLRFIRDLENPRGFERALDNVLHTIQPGIPGNWRIKLPSSARIQVPIGASETGWAQDTNVDDAVGLGMTPGREVEDGLMVDRMEDLEKPAPVAAPRSTALPSTSMSSQSEQEGQPRSTSVWEQVRAANAAQSSQSSWEAIRRRNSVPSAVSGVSSTSSRTTPSSSSTHGKPERSIPAGSKVQLLIIDEGQDPDRAVEQKRFDEMLEEERRRAAGEGAPGKGDVGKWL